MTAQDYYRALHAEHETSFASQPGPGGQWAHSAICTCGWREAYATRSEAEQSAAEHAEESERRRS